MLPSICEGDAYHMSACRCLPRKVTKSPFQFLEAFCAESEATSLHTFSYESRSQRREWTQGRREPSFIDDIQEASCATFTCVRLFHIHQPGEQVLLSHFQVSPQFMKPCGIACPSPPSKFIFFTLLLFLSWQQLPCWPLSLAKLTPALRVLESAFPSYHQGSLQCHLLPEAFSAHPV